MLVPILEWSGKGGEIMKTKNLVVRRPHQNAVLPFPRTIDRMFGDFFGGYDIDPLGEFDRSGLYAISPDLDVCETDKEVKVSACLPGLKEKEIAVEVVDDMLTIRGEKKEACEDKGKDWHTTTESYSAFQRVVPLPSAVDGAKAKAELKKGMLTIALPKAEKERQARRLIPVKAA
jgi:HSP20 family protein